MKDLLVSDRKKIEILRALSDRKVHTYYNLSKITGTNFNTVKKNCNFLELLGFVEVLKISKEESASGVASYRVRITEKGLKFLESL
jgi:predicted transcriptional regulator